jgi:type II secretory pathway pseudopilin PulG
MNALRKRAGFTLVEVLLAAVISVMVFTAMAVVLSRCFSLWKDAMAHWQMAQYSRVTRTRLLDGAFGPGTGLLSTTNHTITPFGGYSYIIYYPLEMSGFQQAYGLSGDSSVENIMLSRSVGSPAAAVAQSVTSSGGFDPPVKINNFNATDSGDVLLITYTLNFSSMGRTFTQPQTIRASLVNE